MKFSRRDVLTHSVAASALGGLGIGTAWSRQSRENGIAIVDRNLPGAESTEAWLRRSWREVVGFDADPGFVWMNVLEPALKERLVSIAGFTSRPTRFCIDYLARPFGLKLEHSGAGFSRNHIWRLAPREI
jgi:hypothetical protein